MSISRLKKLNKIRRGTEWYSRYKNMVERRRSHRFSIGLFCMMEIPSVSGTKVMASTLDISATGFCLSTKENLEVGTQFPIQVTLPSGHREVVTLRVEVLWVQEVKILTATEYKAGVKILEPV